MNREITNNTFKITRWLVQSLLAGVQYIKFAFVGRKDPGLNSKHVVLATHTVKTEDWANQNNLKMDNLWSNISHLISIIDYESSGRAVPKVDGEALDESVAEEEKRRMEEGTMPEPRSIHEYILLKDFNKLVFRLYKKELEDEGEEDDDEVE